MYLQQLLSTFCIMYAFLQELLQVFETLDHQSYMLERYRDTKDKTVEIRHCVLLLNNFQEISRISPINMNKQVIKLR